MSYRVKWEIRGIERWCDFDDIAEAEELALVIGSTVENLTPEPPGPTIKIDITGVPSRPALGDIVELLHQVGLGNTPGIVDITSQPHPPTPDEGPPCEGLNNVQRVATVGAVKRRLADVPDTTLFEVYSADEGESAAFRFEERKNEQGTSYIIVVACC